VVGFLQDCRFAFRQFRHAPGLVFTAVLSLALGAGATTAMFSVIYGVLLNPYPYRDANRMVRVQLLDKTNRGPELYISGPQYPEIRQLPSVDDAIIQHTRSQTLTGSRIPITVRVGIYSPNFFDYMDVPMLLGRGFSTSDAVGTQNTSVVVISYAFWQRQFAGSRDVIGKSIQLDHVLYTIAGVASQRFAFNDCDVYIGANPTGDPHDFWFCFIKLKPGVSREVAAQQLQALIDRFKAADPRNYPAETQVHVLSLTEEVLGQFKGTLVLLFGAVVLLLAIGCSNVSILLLARGTARRQELAVRVSMGARPARLIRQLLTESLLLALTGTCLGILVAYKGVTFVKAALPFYSFPHEAAISINFPVLVFSAAAVLVTGVLSGISPALALARPEVATVLQSSSTKIVGTGSRATHAGLIAGQVALTLLLLTGAGAAATAFSRLIHTRLGFDPQNVLNLDITFPQAPPDSWQSRLNLHENVRRFLAQLPVVQHADYSPVFLPPFPGFRGKVQIQSKPALGEIDADLIAVGPEVFPALKIPLLSGRLFDEAEVGRGAHVALVNDAFVKEFFADRNALGQNVRSPTLNVSQEDLRIAAGADDWLQVVGVVGDTLNDGLKRPVIPAIFIPHSFLIPLNNNLFVGTSVNPDVALRAISESLGDAYPSVILGAQTHSMVWWLDTHGWGQERFIASLFATFAGLALALAATGLYSVVSFVVSQRTQEMGVRLAIGAPRANVIALVLRSTAATLGLGIALGLILSFALSRIIEYWTGGSSREPLTLLASALLLIAAAAVASFIPAWRAANVDPIRCLRSE
jgi:predicted permease